MAAPLQDATGAPSPRPVEVALLASVFVVAACGLVYELAAGALASYLLGDSVLQFSTVIGTYLFAMGVGSYLSRFFERQLLAHFLRIELLVALVGGLLPALLFLANAYTPGAFRVLLYALVLLVGILVGLEIPLVMRILKRNVALKDLVSQVLTFDYLGALAVSLAFPLLLVPQLGLIRTGLLFGLMNAAVALWALWLFRARAAALRRTRCGLRRDAGRRWRAALRRPTRSPRWPKTSSTPTPSSSLRVSPYQRIVVTTPGRRPRGPSPVPQRQPAVRRARRVPLPRGAGAPGDGRVHLGGGAPRKVAVLGGGDGMAVREILRYPGVRERHAGRAGPGHDHAVHPAPHAGAGSTAMRWRRRR